jgi:hypothetical protein
MDISMMSHAVLKPEPSRFGNISATRNTHTTSVAEIL